MANDAFSHSTDPAATHSVTLCAGLPYVGERPLPTGEIKGLRREAMSATAVGCFIPIIMPCVVIALGVAIEPFFSRISKSAGEYAMIFLVLFGIVGCAVGTLRGIEYLERARKIRNVLKKGFVRVFQGPLDWYDPTDRSLQTLLISKLFTAGNANSATIELFPHLNEAYAVNGIAVRKVVSLTLTTAAPRPADVTIYDVPKSWEIEAPGFTVERRRPSADELAELASYARLSYRYWIKIVFYGALASFVFGMWAVRIANFFLERTAGDASQAANVQQLSLRAAIIAPIVVAVVISKRVRKTLRAVRNIRQDIECGWIFVVTGKSNPNADGETVSVERLPISDAIWTLGGKPAGWRRHQT